MVAPIEPISNLAISSFNVVFPISSKRMQQILKKLNDEEKNYKYRSHKEIEESWEQFRFRQKPKKDNNEL